MALKIIGIQKSVGTMTNRKDKQGNPAPDLPYANYNFYGAWPLEHSDRNQNCAIGYWFRSADSEKKRLPKSEIHIKIEDYDKYIKRPISDFIDKECEFYFNQDGVVCEIKILK